MQNGNLMEELSIKFALRVIKLYKYLFEEKKEHIMSKQVYRSGTSIGANIAESINAQSRADFISKLSISLKEATETKYCHGSYILHSFILSFFHFSENAS